MRKGMRCRYQQKASFRIKPFMSSPGVSNASQPPFIDWRPDFLEPPHIRTHENALITSPTTS